MVEDWEGVGIACVSIQFGRVSTSFQIYLPGWAHINWNHAHLQQKINKQKSALHKGAFFIEHFGLLLNRIIFNIFWYRDWFHLIDIRVFSLHILHNIDGISLDTHCHIHIHVK